MGPTGSTFGQRSAGLQTRVLYCVFLVSGTCGLIYESIWSHYLKLFVGHAAYAQTVVLVVFIGGMALGAWLVGRNARAVASPLAWYALIEGVIGVASLGFHNLFVASTEWAYASLLPAACIPETPCLAQWLFAALLILPQSILLGTTFPLMASGVLRLSPQEPGRRIALLYFLNSIGAAAGVLLAGFLLVPALGLPGTLLTAALLNIAVAIVAWVCARSAQRPGPPSVPEPRDGGGYRSLRTWLMLVAGLTGLSSFIYEIIWIRMLALVVGASTHAFEVMLAAFILGLALGGLWVRRRIDRFADLIRTLAVVQVLMGVAAMATLALYDGMFDVMGAVFDVLRRTESGYVAYNLVSHVLALAIMLPATFLAGMTFPLITTTLLRGPDGERAIGYTYAANTLGSVAGVMLAVHFALPVLGIKGGLLFGASIDVALGIALLALRTQSGIGGALRWGAAGAVALLGLAIAVPVLPERMASGVYRAGSARVERDYKVLYHRDGKTASVTVIQSPEVTTISTNGKPDASIARVGIRPTPDEVTMVFTGLLPLAYHPEARTAAVIGFGSGITTTTLLASPNVERVDTIEIEPRMIEGAMLFGSVVAPAFHDPRSRIVFDDAKSHFARSGLRYDVIVSEPSNPWVSGVASLFTQEFYGRVRKQLNPRGVFVQWIQFYEFNDQLLAAILSAVDSEFRNYRVYASNDVDIVIVASADALPEGPSGDHTEWPKLRSLAEPVKLASAGDVEARRLAGETTIRLLVQVLGESRNSDYYPVVDQGAPRARFVGDSASGLMNVATAPVPLQELIGDAVPRPPAGTASPIAPPMLLTLRQSAIASRSFLLNGTAIDGMIALPRDIGLLRAAILDCAKLPPRASLPELMLSLAVVVNPTTDRAQAVSLWEALGSAPCAPGAGSDDRAWMELFAAVAARDTLRMSELGVTLAGRADISSALRSYAILAGSLGLVASGRAPDAERFIASSASRLTEAQRRDLPIRVIAALSRHGQWSQALTR